MAFGEITKQLAQQALGEALRSPEASSTPKTPESSGSVILSQIQAMQKALKPEDELVVFLSAGNEKIRVLDIFAPSWQVFVLTGVDAEKNTTRIVTHADCLQLVCKVMRSRTPDKPARIGITTPKTKSE